MFAFMRGASLRRKQELKLALWCAYHVEAFARTKGKLPNLTMMLDKIDGGGKARVQSPKEQRAAIIGIATAFGATVRRKPKSEAVN